MVSIASSRTLSAIEIIATGFITAGSFSPEIAVAECAKTITRKPICAYCFTILSTLAGQGFNTNSGAPIAKVPMSSKVTAENFLLEENGIFAIAEYFSLNPKWLLSAIEVWLFPSSSRSILPIISFMEWSPTVFKITVSLTFILPSVIVPVLSRHSTFTRASISSEYISCTSVFDFASLIIPTASASEVSSSIPEGIIPITTVQVR